MVILAVEDERDRVVAVKGVDKAVRVRRRAERIRRAVRFVASVPEEERGAVFDAVHLVGDGGGVLVGAVWTHELGWRVRREKEKILTTACRT